MKTPLLSNPKLLDKAIQQIQVVLGGLTFLDKSFGLAERRERDKKKYPSVYQGEKLDEYEVSPKDDIGAFCFWDKTGEITPRYADDGGAPKRQYANLTYNVALIFYTFDVKRLDLANDVRQSKTIIMQNFLNKLERGLLVCQSNLIITGILDDDITEIYRGYDVLPIKQPQYAIRFECELSFNESCFV